MMDSYYSSMKEDMGIMEKQDDYAEEDHKLEEVLRTLRPNTTAKNFKHFLARQENITRTTHWKAVARGLETREKKGGQDESAGRRNIMNNKSMVVTAAEQSYGNANFMKKRVYS